MQSPLSTTTVPQVQVANADLLKELEEILIRARAAQFRRHSPDADPETLVKAQGGSMYKNMFKDTTFMKTILDITDSQKTIGILGPYLATILDEKLKPLTAQSDNLQPSILVGTARVILEYHLAQDFGRHPQQALQFAPTGTNSRGQSPLDLVAQTVSAERFPSSTNVPGEYQNMGRDLGARALSLIKILYVALNPPAAVPPLQPVAFMSERPPQLLQSPGNRTRPHSPLRVHTNQSATGSARSPASLSPHSAAAARSAGASGKRRVIVESTPAALDVGPDSDLVDDLDDLNFDEAGSFRDSASPLALSSEDIPLINASSESLRSRPKLHHTNSEPSLKLFGLKAARSAAGAVGAMIAGVSKGSRQGSRSGSRGPSETGSAYSNLEPSRHIPPFAQRPISPNASVPTISTDNDGMFTVAGLADADDSLPLIGRLRDLDGITVHDLTGPTFWRNLIRHTDGCTFIVSGGSVTYHNPQPRTPAEHTDLDYTPAKEPFGVVAFVFKCTNKKHGRLGLGCVANPQEVRFKHTFGSLVAQMEQGPIERVVSLACEAMLQFVRRYLKPTRPHTARHGGTQPDSAEGSHRSDQ